MPTNSKINLYDIQVPKKTNSSSLHQKPVAKLKIALFSLLAITTAISIGQSLSSFDSKTSFADNSSQNSSTSMSSK